MSWSEEQSGGGGFPLWPPLWGKAGWIESVWGLSSGGTDTSGRVVRPGATKLSLDPSQ